MTLRDDLIAAKALIDTPEKWLRNDAGDGGRYCALGACWKIEKPNDIGHLGRALTKALPAGFAPNGSTKLAVAQFNDLPSTTHADIMALFQRAIDAADSAS